MTLDDMTHQEKLVLVGLARLMVRLDHEFTEEEAGALGHLIDEMGSDQFWKLIEEASGLEDDAVRKAATEVSNEESQELIYGSLYEVAIAGSIEEGENELLDWLEETWGLEVQDIAPDDDDDGGDVASADEEE